MAGTLIKVRFKLAWQNYRVGDVITPSGVQRDWLMANGYVEPLLPEKRPGVRTKAKAAADAVGSIFTR